MKMTPTLFAIRRRWGVALPGRRLVLDAHRLRERPGAAARILCADRARAAGRDRRVQDPHDGTSNGRGSQISLRAVGRHAASGPGSRAHSRSIRSCLFLDEPTAGLDPIGAAAFDEQTRGLQETLGLTIFLITHDLDTLHAICDRVAVIATNASSRVGTIPELLALDHPWIQEYFNGARGRIAMAGDAALNAVTS